MKNIIRKAKDIGYEALWALLYCVCSLIGGIIAVLYVLLTAIFMAPLAAIPRTILVEESYSDAYYNVFMSIMALLYGEKCCESKEEIES